jgi:hypothetical protein
VQEEEAIAALAEVEAHYQKNAAEEKVFSRLQPIGQDRFNRYREI